MNAEQLHLRDFLFGLNHKKIELDQKFHLEIKFGIQNFLDCLQIKASSLQKQYPFHDFNIFNVMRYGHYETRLHTPFLVYLFQQNNSNHGGRNFMDNFLKRIFPDLNTQKVGPIKVIEELSTSFGQMDIFIQFTYESKLFSIVIENKLDAVDQENQLQRYHDFLESRKSNNCVNKLIYLTKNGRNPSIPYSISESDFKDLINTNELILLSYRHDISRVISVYLKEIPESGFKQTLRQYHELISKF